MAAATRITRSPLNDASLPPADLKERFYRYFQVEVTELQDQMAQLEHFSLAGGERQDALDHCLAGISRLSNEVTDASAFIPAYDQRTYAQAIKALSEKLQETRSRLAPKSKFRFKTTNKNNSAISLTDAVELEREGRLQSQSGKALSSATSGESPIATTPSQPLTPQGERDALSDLPSFPKNYNDEMTKRPDGPIRKPSFSQATNIDISGHSGLHIILPSTAARATSFGSVTKMSRCVVDMSVPTANGAPFAGLAMKNIKHSLIVAGHVAGAAHITDVQNSVIVVASRQVRMHDCKNVDIYLHCASRPIIEDCQNVRFAPMPKCYSVATEEPAQNHWDQVDDFKWLKSEHSPNWSVLPDHERLGEQIWTKTVPGGPGVGVDDILKKVGVEG